MPEANAGNAGDGSGDAVEMVKWTTPDGVELDVPAEQLKGLEGIGERFSNLTKSEQDISTREKALDRSIAKAEEAGGDRAWDDLDEESFRVLAESKGFSELLAEAAGEASGDEYNPQAEIEKLRAELVERDKVAEENADAVAAERAEQTYAAEMTEIAEGLDEFKALTGEHLQEQAYGHAWGILEKSEFDGDIEEAVKAGIEYATGLQTEIIEAHAASKASGPGAPGKAAGDIQRPQKFENDAERDAYIQSKSAAMLADAEAKLEE